MGRFRYKIETPNFDSQFVESPDGWEDNESTFPRSEGYKGIFRRFSANELTFYDNAAKFLRQIYAQTKFESKATFVILEQDFITYSEFERFRGEIDFVTFSDETTNSGNSVTVKVIDSSFWNTIKNREKVNPQLSQLVSLDGNQIIGFTNEEQFLNLPSVPETLTSAFQAKTEAISSNHIVPLVLSESEDTNAVTPVTPLFTFYHVNTLSYGVEIQVDYQTQFDIPTRNATINLVIGHYDSGGALKNPETILSTISGFDEIKLLMYSGSASFVPALGDYFKLEIKINFGGTAVALAPYGCNAYVLSIVDEISLSLVSGIMSHEAMSRIAQLYTGIDKPIYSNILGRQNSEPVSYDENGALSELFITNGERLRGFTKEESPVSLGFKTLFDSLNAIHPIGICIEKINGIDTLRIEDIKYFYDDRVILTLEGVSNIKHTVMSEKVFNKIVSGYNKAEYELRKGLNEFNQKSQFSTPISVIEKEYQIVSQIRADNNAIMGARRKPKSTFPTEDTKFDSDNYFIKVIQGDNKILNGNFEAWVDDNTPNDWTVATGIVERKSILGSNRCYIKDGVLSQGSVSQIINYATPEEIGIKFSYENIGAFTVSISVSVRIVGQPYWLNTDGTWGATQAFIYPVVGLAPTPENMLQSLQVAEITSNIMPVAGDVEIKITAPVGVIIDDVFTGEAQYLAKNTQGFTVVENTPFGDSSLNLDITPARNLRNHGKLIRAGLESGLNKYIKFNTSDKNSTTITQKDTEAESVAEDADILINSLDAPFLSPEKFSFECEIDKDFIDTINDTFLGETKPKYLGMIKFRQSNENYRYIWLLDIQTGGEKGQGSVTGIEVNTNYITPQ